MIKHYFYEKLSKRNKKTWDSDIDISHHGIDPFVSTFFTGNAGTGKTVAMIKSAKNYYETNPAGDAEFLKFSDLIETAKLSQQFGEDGYQYRKDIEYTMNVENLYLDDLGTEKQTEFVNSMIYKIIDYRYENELQTSITSNFSIEQLKERYHERIADRIQEMCVVKNLSGTSFRSLNLDDKKVRSEMITA